MTLREWRDKVGRSQDSIAEAVDASQSTIDRIEKGQQNASLNLLQRIVDLTNGEVTLDDLAMGRAA